MGTISQKMKRSVDYEKYINKILRNQEMDCDEDWRNNKDSLSELQELACREENYVTDSTILKIESAKKLIVAVFWQDPDEFLKTVTKRIEKLPEKEKTAGIELVFFVRDMKNRISLERTFDTKTLASLRRMARKSSGNKSLGIHCTYILQKEYDIQEVKLTGLRRHEMIQMPPIEGKINQERLETCEDSGERINALVFTVDLYQLVKLYNLIGDALFKNNVRFGINETLGVDYSIQRTLEMEPDLFWFKNNGVTILVEDPDFMPRNVEELKLGDIGPDKDPNFSVVNGAQTITTAAKYFFNMEYNWQNSQEGSKEKSDYLKKLNSSKQAQVILRIIQISGAGKAAASANTAKDISVALNRQKPIKMEDIAFTLWFVEKLTRYLAHIHEDNSEAFLLIRRGEESSTGEEMDLTEFARARLACIGRPGEARSQGAKVLLKIRTEDDAEDTFQRKDIFVPEWTEADENEEASVFQRHYGAVWFAHKVAGEYEIQKKNVIKDTEHDFSTVINNGKWYFTAILVQLLNGLAVDCGVNVEEFYDFSDFTTSFLSVQQKIPEAMKYFAGIVLAYKKEKEKYGELNSNLFKKEELYIDLIKEIKHVFASDPIGRKENGIEREVRGLADLFSVTDRMMAGVEAAAATEETLTAWKETAVGRSEAVDAEPELIYTDSAGKRKKSEAAKMSHLVLRGVIYPCKILALAQAETVRHILENYHIAEEQLQGCSDWITSKREKGESKEKYFRSAKQIKVNGKDYWVGTSSNQETKYSQVRALCEAAHVGENEIFWYMEAQENPVFSW